MVTTDRHWALISITLTVAAWHLVSTFLFSPTVLPPPLVVLATAWEMARSGELWVHISYSMTRILIGYIVGSAIGLAAGLAMGRVETIRYFFDPLIDFVRAIPPVAMIPLAITWFGIYEQSKIFIILYTGLIVVTLNAMAGVGSVPVIRLRAAACLGARPWTLFRRVTLPSALPYILTGMRVALGFCFMSVVAAEIIAADAGLGYLIMSASLTIQTQRMYVGLVTLALLGFATDRTFHYLVARTMKRYVLDIKGLA